MRVHAEELGGLLMATILSLLVFYGIHLLVTVIKIEFFLTF